ncbi:MAG TPA: hypothetical protein VKE96_25800 [Vicinamibacterales bacterium]|nr:hypothetical protein [Vicinamibacterales bacterium]
MALGRWLTSDWLPGAPSDPFRALAEATPLMLRGTRELHDDVSIAADGFLLKRKARSEPLPAIHEVMEPSRFTKRESRGT